MTVHITWVHYLWYMFAGVSAGIMTGPYFMSMILDVVLMVLSLLSTALCIRSMVKARKLRQVTTLTWHLIIS